MDLSTQDRQRISAAIHQAEKQTSGEIVCVLAHASTDAKALPIFIAAVAALLLPWFLVALTSLSVQRILVLQILLFAALTVLLCLPRVRVALMPRAARRAVAHRVAMEQFVVRGLTHRKDGAAVMIFVSVAERYARIIAADGIAAHVPKGEWQKAVDSLVAHVRSGHVADGFIAAIEKSGAVLAQYFPPDPAARNDLPNRIYVI